MELQAEDRWMLVPRDECAMEVLDEETDMMVPPRMQQASGAMEVLDEETTMHTPPRMRRVA
jgi:hypothetical protein